MSTKATNGNVALTLSTVIDGIPQTGWTYSLPVGLVDNSMFYIDGNTVKFGPHNFKCKNYAVSVRGEKLGYEPVSMYRLIAIGDRNLYFSTNSPRYIYFPMEAIDINDTFNIKLNYYLSNLFSSYKRFYLLGTGVDDITNCLFRLNSSSAVYSTFQVRLGSALSSAVGLTHGKNGGYKEDAAFTLEIDCDNTGTIRVYFGDTLEYTSPPGSWLSLPAGNRFIGTDNSYGANLMGDIKMTKNGIVIFSKSFDNDTVWPSPIIGNGNPTVGLTNPVPNVYP